MIRAVLFDLDNTLIDFYRMKNEACLSACKAMHAGGLPLSPDNAFKRLMGMYWELGIEYEHIFQDFLKKEIGKVDYRLLAKAVIAYRVTKQSFAKPMPGVNSTLLELHKRKIATGVVSDAPALRAWVRLVQMKLEDSFSVVVTFDDTGKTKPSPEPFKRAIESLALPPREILFVGDKPERDIIGARSIGMRTAFARYGNSSFTGKSGADIELTRIEEILTLL